MKTQTLTAKFIVVSTLLGLASGAMASSSTPSHCGPNTIPDPNRPAICIVDPVFIKKVQAEAAAAVDTQEKYDEAFADGVASVDITQECADLPGADLSGADLSYADLSNTSLYGMNLSNAWFYRTNLSSMDLSYADLSGAELAHTDLSGADLSGADLSSVDLSDSDLSGADLSNTDLSNMFIQRSDFTGANLSGANLKGSQLKWSDLDDVIWTGAFCPDGENADDNGGTCENNL